MFEVPEENQEKETYEVEKNAAWQDELGPDSHPGSSKSAGNEFSNHAESIDHEKNLKSADHSQI